MNNVRGQMRAFFDGLGQVSTSRCRCTRNLVLRRRASSRAGRAGQNAIAEMPYFTFLYGDLHAHMMAMPVTLLALAWLLAEILGAGRRLRTWWEAGLAVGIGALAVGLLRPTNTWDWITYLLLGAAGLTYVAWLGAVRSPGSRPASRLADRLWDLLPDRARCGRCSGDPVMIAARPLSSQRIQPSSGLNEDCSQSAASGVDRWGWSWWGDLPYCC